MGKESAKEQQWGEKLKKQLVAGHSFKLWLSLRELMSPLVRVPVVLKNSWETKGWRQENKAASLTPGIKKKKIIKKLQVEPLKKYYSFGSTFICSGFWVFGKPSLHIFKLSSSTWRLEISFKNIGEDAPAIIWLQLLTLQEDPAMLQVRFALIWRGETCLQLAVQAL